MTHPGSGRSPLSGRVLVLSGFWPPHEGGVERYSASLAGELARRGLEVHAAAADVGHVSIGSGAGEHPVAVHRYPIRMVGGRLPLPRILSRRWRTLRREVAAHPFDLVVVMTHHYVGSVLLARAARTRRLLWIEHVSGPIPAGRGRALQRLVDGYEHILARLQRRIATDGAGVSTASVAWLARLGVATDRIVPNAVEPALLAPRPRTAGSDTFEVAFVGRLEPAKGADAAVRIVRTLAARLPTGTDVRLRIAGGGTRAAELDAAVAEAVADAVAGAGDARIDVLGALPHDAVLDLLRTSDVLLVPSRYPEGLPTVLLEAGALGTPVVAYPAGGTADLVEDGVTGRVVDDEEGAVEALLALHADPGPAHAMAHALTERIRERFTWPVVVDALLAGLDLAGLDLAADPEVSRVP